MRKMIGSALIAAAVSILLAACAQSPAPVQALPPGPTGDEVANYARAQAQYRAGLASGNGDVVMHATNTFSLIASEILSRQDPKLFDAQVLCERYRVIHRAEHLDVVNWLSEQPRWLRPVHRQQTRGELHFLPR
jgi:hypothetical protein